VAFTLSVVNSNVERFSVTKSVDVMEIAETLDGGESVSHSFAGMVSLSKVKVSRVVLENSTSVVLLAKGGHPVAATHIVPSLVRTKMDTIFVSPVVRLSSSPSGVGKGTTVNVFPVAFMFLIVNTDPDVFSVVTSKMVDSINIMDVVNSGEVHAPSVTLVLSLALGEASRVVSVMGSGDDAGDSSHSGSSYEHCWFN
jgi:hypothetical protein